MAQREMSRAFGSTATKSVVTLPIVFHVIHSGEALGVKSNLAESRIIEQMVTLNQDFRRQNPDASNTPSQFLSVAADMEINFVLAKQDPSGLPTNGITRTNFNKETFNDSDLSLLTSIIQWPPEDYINVYVCNFKSLGYAVFPFSDLPGAKVESENIREKDGLIVKYSYIGNNDKSSEVVFESKGRTLTHELGHYLGVFHNWHGGCGSTGDYCADTPPQTGGANGACDQNVSRLFCEEEERPMIENFMDYTNDVCMNLFTQCQKNRMQTVLQFSPRRASLPFSHALQDPVITVNDLGLIEIRSPLKTDCSSTFFPAVQVRNFGSNNITQLKISMAINGETKQTIDTNINLQPYETSVASFGLEDISSEVFPTVSFEIEEVNGAIDNNSSNNVLETIVSSGESSIAPYYYDFENDQTANGWTETNEATRWQVVNAPNANAQNKAAKLTFFGTKENYGIKDLLVTNILDLSALSSAQLSFKYSYAGNFIGEFQDKLIVAISNDCGATFNTSNYIFERQGNGLTSAPSTSSAFTPSGESDWDLINLNITPWLSDHMQIAFIGVNGGGNNLYIDDISITSTNLPAYDIGIRKLVQMPTVTCRNDIYPKLNVRNFGFNEINKINVEVMVDNDISTQVFDDIKIPSGQTKDLAFKFELPDGPHTFSFDIQLVNDQMDTQLDNNYVYHQMIVEDTVDAIPIKETFNSDIISWSLVSPTAESFLDLEKVSRSNNILKANMYDQPTVGAQTYLVSPNLKTLNYTTAAIRFKLSYARRANFNDNLKILLSNDCGATYDIEVYNRNSADLSEKFSEEEWTPTEKEDWSLQYVDISDHLGWSDLRVALVFTSGQGNSMYIDDLEIITYNDPLQFIPDVNVVVYPNPVTAKQFNLIFNLPRKQLVQVKMVDMSGRVVIDEKIDNALNQKIKVVTPTQKGFYFVTVVGQDVNTVKRIYIQ